jgi:hypothetical protein
MVSPPSKQDFGIENNLDVKSTWEHFGGKSLDEAYVVFASNAFYYQEYLMWMDTPAFLFYFPIAVRYIMSESAKGDSDTVSSVAGLLAFRFKCDGVESTRSLFEQIKALCDYVITNYDQFDINFDIYGDVKDKYKEIKRHIESSSANN